MISFCYYYELYYNNIKYYNGIRYYHGIIMSEWRYFMPCCVRGAKNQAYQEISNALKSSPQLLGAGGGTKTILPLVFSIYYYGLTWYYNCIIIILLWYYYVAVAIFRAVSP